MTEERGSETECDHIGRGHTVIYLKKQLWLQVNRVENNQDQKARQEGDMVKLVNLQLPKCSLPADIVAA